MTANRTERASGSSPRGVLRRTLESWRSTLILALALPGLSGCGGDFHLAASNLEIGPNPAVPGDMVVASFLIGLLPPENHTIIFIIDDEEHLRIESNEPPPIPYVIPLGDAADLIDTYGLGEHDAYVQVHARDDVARTQAIRFVLNEAEPEA